MSAERQRSREFGIKLAKGLLKYAAEHKTHPETGAPLVYREVILGALDYLTKRTKFWRESPLDLTQPPSDN